MVSSSRKRKRSADTYKIRLFVGGSWPPQTRPVHNPMYRARGRLRIMEYGLTVPRNLTSYSEPMDLARAEASLPADGNFHLSYKVKNDLGNYTAARLANDSDLVCCMHLNLHRAKPFDLFLVDA